MKTAQWQFTVPTDLVATAPPEARGLRRDHVKLMVVGPDRAVDARFDDLPHHLRRGDLLVVNSSPTMAAAVEGSMRGRPVGVHFSTEHDDRSWTIELRRLDGSGPVLDAVVNEIIRIPGGWIRLLAPADRNSDGGVRLWNAQPATPSGVRSLLHDYGRPIRYGYVAREWPLSMYQTVFADNSGWPGSAEMPSAGRPFTTTLISRLRAAGVNFAALQLHAGVSSQEAHEAPQAERFNVPPETAAAVNATRLAGGRVIAVGTTVTRALETVADGEGRVTARGGWTNLVLEPDSPVRIVDGLVTGWHPPEASHLHLLEAVAGAALVSTAYERALESGYLWHEFGDSCLLLPDRSAGAYSIAA